MNPAPYPLYLQAHLSRRLWGDVRLQDWLGLPPAGAGDPWGESWQVWSGNLIVNGPLTGRTLQEAADLWGPALLGTASVQKYGNRFPLLAKFIAAAQDLSLQVHPDDEQARTWHPDGTDLGKAEAWLILEASPGARVCWGFRETVSEAQVREAVTDGTLESLLNQVEVKPGDVIYNPAGTVHAVGAGILLFEIQQASDLTYRLYDFNRRDSSGNLRELHLTEALRVADLRGGLSALHPSRELRSGERELVATPHFVLTELAPDVAGSLQTGTASVELLTAVSGSVTLSSDQQRLELPAGTSLVLPAVSAGYRLTGPGRLLRSYLPPGQAVG